MAAFVQRARYSSSEDAMRSNALLHFMWKAAGFFAEDRENDLCGLRRATGDDADAAFRRFEAALQNCLADGSLQQTMQDYAAYHEIPIDSSIPSRVAKALQETDAWFGSEIKEPGDHFYGLSHDSIYEDLLPNLQRFVNMIRRVVDEDVRQPNALKVMLKLQSI